MRWRCTKKKDEFQKVEDGSSVPKKEATDVVQAFVALAEEVGTFYEGQGEQASSAGK